MNGKNIIAINVANGVSIGVILMGWAIILVLVRKYFLGKSGKMNGPAVGTAGN